MKKLYTSIILAMMFASAVLAKVREPYLEVPTSSSVWINWKSDVETGFTIEYGLYSDSLKLSKSVTTLTWTDNGYSNNYLYSSVQLTGLKANTKYFYRIKNASYTGAIYSFKTAPAKGKSANNGITRFLIMGDNQLKDEPRYDTLCVRAKRYIEKKYNAPIQDVVSSILMVGDQVDVGTLDHYEYVHFDKVKYISPYVGSSTIIGNHETYGTLKLDAYKNHFHYDGLSYKVASGSEEYYAYQTGTTLFINLTTEGSSTLNATQLTWLQKVCDSAKVDNTVKHIVSLGHRPYQAEQYIGDISTWVRNTAYPVLLSSGKHFLHVGAHHHLYARGQDKNNPSYNIISGGTAWDQYWGMSKEADYDDCQKTLTRWNYQLLEIDSAANMAKVKTFSIGYTTKINDWGNLNKFVWENSIIIDSFYVKPSIAKPATPTISNTITDSIALPYTFNSSAYSTTSGEKYNSTQFQISQNSNFSTLVIDKIRDFENWFGKGTNAWDTKDLNTSIDIFKLTLTTGTLSNGTYYIRVRHRDRGMNWSNWSPTVTYKVKAAGVAKPTVSIDKQEYTTNETIVATYSNGPGNAKDWIGIYKLGDVPGGGPTATKWSYVNAGSLVAGTLNFTLPTSGQYFIGYFSNDGYTEIAKRDTFYVGAIPVIMSLKSEYKLTDSVSISYTNAPAGTKDWMGIYKIGNIPGVQSYSAYKYANAASGTLKFTGLPKGYYKASYFLNDKYLSIGNSIFFSVGDTIAKITTNKSTYNLGDLISVTFQDGPGVAKDWLGIYNANDNPNVNPLVNYTYVAGKTSGTQAFQSDNVPQKTGDYFVVFFTNDSYNEISNRAYFKIKSILTDVTDEAYENKVNVYPNPSAPSKETAISYKYPIDLIEIFDVSGQLIYSKSNLEDKNSIVLNHNLPQGTYFVSVHSNKLYRVKLVVTEE